jgi:hypothetical protein
MARDVKLKVSIELTGGEGEVLLKFLDRIGQEEASSEFKKASERLRVALEKELAKKATRD